MLAEMVRAWEGMRRYKIVVQVGKSAEEVQHRPGRVLEWLMQHKHRGTGRDCADSGDLPQQQWRSC